MTPDTAIPQTPKYPSDKEMVLADTLSRAYIPSQNDDRSETEKDTEIFHMTSHLAISEPQLKEIQQATSEDETLKDVMKIIIEVWPAKKDGLHARVHPYCHIRDELATQNGIVLKGPSAVIPEDLRKKIREKLHVAHTGIQSLRRAREVVYWPGMNKDLIDYIAKCDTSNTFQNNQWKEPLISLHALGSLLPLISLPLMTKITCAQWTATRIILKLTGYTTRQLEKSSLS